MPAIFARTRWRRIVTVIGLTAIAIAVAVAAPLSARAQEDSGTWRVSGSLGIAIDAARSDDADTAPTGLLAGVAIDRSLDRSFAVGLEWTGSWFDEAIGGGGSRHRLGPYLEMSPFGTALAVRATAAMGIATVVDIDGPPSDGLGDAVIAIGQTGGFAASVQANWPLTLHGRVRLGPSIEATWHRAGGASFMTLGLGGRIGLNSRPAGRRTRARRSPAASHERD